MAPVGGEDLARAVTFDPPIHSYLGLEFVAITPSLCLARFQVGDSSKQISGQLHGGVSALVAESVASTGASVASKGQLVLGLDVSCSHLRGAPIGTQVLVVGRPLRAGRLVQVWEVHLFNIGSIDYHSSSITPDTPTVRHPGNLEVRASLDDDTSMLLDAAERDEKRLVAVARVSVLVRATPATAQGIESVVKAHKPLARL